MQVLDSGDARFEHLESRVERIEIRIDAARRHAAGEPELERIVGRPELEGCETHMMVAIDQARHDHMFGRTKGRVGLILLRQRRIWADGQDSAIALGHGAILDHVGLGAAADFTDDILAANKRQGHRVLLINWSVLPRITEPLGRRSRKTWPPEMFLRAPGDTAQHMGKSLGQRLPPVVVRLTASTG